MPAIDRKNRCWHLRLIAIGKRETSRQNGIRIGIPRRHKGIKPRIEIGFAQIAINMRQKCLDQTVCAGTAIKMHTHRWQHDTIEQTIKINLLSLIDMQPERCCTLLYIGKQKPVHGFDIITQMKGLAHIPPMRYPLRRILRQPPHACRHIASKLGRAAVI